MLDPRQNGGSNEETELIAARKDNENDAANRQTDTQCDDAPAAVDVTDNGVIFEVHGQEQTPGSGRNSIFVIPRPPSAGSRVYRSAPR
jgi:hypothetical protein